MKKRTQIRKRPEKKTRVKAWIYTVINPIVDSLNIELKFLNEKNWTWRHNTRTLAAVQPLDRYVDSAHVPIFEEFFTEFPDFEKMRMKHDELRAALSEQCGAVFHYLIEQAPYQGNMQQTLSTFEQEGNEYPGGAVPRNQFPQLIAEYIINKTPELPDHYTTSKFWARYGEKFKSLRRGPLFEELDRAGEALLQLDERLLHALKAKRKNLCESYDIPPAPVDFGD